MERLVWANEWVSVVRTGVALGHVTHASGEGLAAGGKRSGSLWKTLWACSSDTNTLSLPFLFICIHTHTQTHRQTHIVTLTELNPSHLTDNVLRSECRYSICYNDPFSWMSQHDKHSHDHFYARLQPWHFCCTDKIRSPISHLVTTTIRSHGDSTWNCSLLQMDPANDNQEVNLFIKKRNYRVKRSSLSISLRIKDRHVALGKGMAVWLQSVSGTDERIWISDRRWKCCH